MKQKNKLKIMKNFILLFSVFFFPFLTNAQDIIILKNNVNYKCTVVEVKKCVVTFSIAKKYYKIPAQDVNGIAIDISKKMGVRKTRVFSRKAMCFNPLSQKEQYQLFTSANNPSMEVMSNLNPGNLKYETNDSDILRYWQKGYMMKKSGFAVLGAGAGALGALILYALLL